MLNVKKRDGRIVPFQLAKISKAIEKAFIAKEKNYTKDIIDTLALRVCSQMDNLVRNEIVNIEDIQDSAEIVLIQAGYADIAKAYILYRNKRKSIRQSNLTLLDYKETVDKYLDILDWRVKENSTVTYSMDTVLVGV